MSNTPLEPIVADNERQTFLVAGVGASAGGLEAYRALIKEIPKNSGIAWVLVQHQHPTHESMLTELLQSITTVPVITISNNLQLKPGNIYVMPHNKMLTVKAGKLNLTSRPAYTAEGNYVIDLFFISLAQAYESDAIGIVLSGTASDGTNGLKAIKDYGGISVAQTIESAAYPGMPESAIKAGVVDYILEPKDIPLKLLEIKEIISQNEQKERLSEDEEQHFKEVLSILHKKTGMDFTNYKQTTICRRILRRMVLNKFKRVSDYADYLKTTDKETEKLYQDMLIPVTSFFRDEKVFNNLCETVFPNLIKNKSADGHIRIWVAGCSTGEEAYSIAICFKEYLGHREEKVQIFATDLSEPAIAKARTGLYTKKEAELVSHHRLTKFFTLSGGRYLINRDVREMCVFAVHNFLKDPPFLKIDFISCRNVLIYMNTYLQKKALTTFHYALNTQGQLMLGKSENTTGISDLFITNNKAERIFTRRNIVPKIPRAATKPAGLPAIKNGVLPAPLRTDFQKIADDVILAKYTPAAVVVNELLDILHFRGNTSQYLQQAPGKPSHNLLKMAKTGLAFELRNILQTAITEKRAIKKENIPVVSKNLKQLISIEVIPLQGLQEPLWLIVFDNPTGTYTSLSAAKANKLTKKDEDTLRLQQLEQELVQLNEDMRGVTDKQEAGNEELQSTNEELLSSNEELQSLNEELESSKEELQSTIEELTVVNLEMINLNEQLAVEKDYAEAILATIPQPMLVLDKDLRIVLANQLYYQHFLESEHETEGRYLFDIGNQQWNISNLKESLEAILPENKSFVAFEVEQNFTKIGKRIMRLNAREIIREKEAERILLVIEDVTNYVQAARKIAETEHRYSSMIYSSPFMIAILEGIDLVIKDANDAILKTWQKGREIIGQPLAHAVPQTVERGTYDSLQKVFETGEAQYGYELPVPMLLDGKTTTLYYSFIFQALKDIDGDTKGVAILANEVTPQAIFNQKIKESENVLQGQKRLYEAVAENTPDLIYVFDLNYRFTYANKALLSMWGKTFEDSIGKGLLELGYEPWHATMHENEIDQVVATKESVRGIVSFPHATAGIRIYDYILAPVINENGKVEAVVGTTRDVTDIKESEKKLIVSEQELLKTTEHFEIATAAASVGTWSLDLQTERLTWSGLHKKMWGYDENRTDLMYADWHKIIFTEDKENAFFEIDKALKSKTPYEAFYRINKHDTKEERWIKSSGQYFYDSNGNAVALTGVSIDITEQKKAELILKESERNFRQLAELMPDLVSVADSTGQVNYYSGNWEEYSGLSRGQLYKDGWSMLMHPDQLEAITQRWLQSVETGNNFEIELLLLNKIGTYKWHLSRAAAVKDENGQVVKWIGSMTNIQKIKEEEQQKEAFIRMVSHELKTPITSIKGYVQFLLALLKKETESSTVLSPVKSSLTRIDIQVTRLTRLITEMLDLSRIEAGKLELQKKAFSLNDLVKETIQDVSHITTTHRIALLEEAECEVIGDRDRVGQVLINFINNALKYSPAGDVVNIKVFKTFGNSASVSVQDFGIGIDKEDQQKIFERFYRVEGENEETFSGFGIGLYIANEIIQEHKGSISVQSLQGQGSTFTFEIPL